MGQVGIRLALSLHEADTLRCLLHLEAVDYVCWTPDERSIFDGIAEQIEKLLPAKEA